MRNEQEIDTKVPNVYVTDLEISKKIRQANADDTTEVSFEFIIASLFPTSWENIISNESSIHPRVHPR